MHPQMASIISGGWCRKRCKSGDGPTHNRYELRQTSSGDYAQGTECKEPEVAPFVKSATP